MDPKQLEIFLRCYVEEFNRRAPRIQMTNPSLQVFLEPIAVVRAFIATDGTFAFFVPERYAKAALEANGPLRISLIDEELTMVVQRMTANFVKVLNRPQERLLGDLSNFQMNNLLPPDLPDRDLGPVTFSPDYLEWGQQLPADTVIQVQGVAVSPQWRFVDGLVVGALPTRARIYSPTVPQSVGPMLQYAWTFADFFWEFNQMELVNEAAVRLCTADLQLLRQAFESQVPVSPTSRHDSVASVIEGLMRICDQFEQLIDNPSTAEADVQAYLELPQHRFIIAPDHEEVWNRKRIGPYVTDFTVLETHGDYCLIEIESPNSPCVTRVGREPSAESSHALTQVRDWLNYIRLNRDTVIRDTGFAQLNRPRGKVVVGRNRDMVDNTAVARFDDLRSSNRADVELLTYDMLLSSAKGYVQSLERAERLIS